MNSLAFPSQSSSRIDRKWSTDSVGFREVVPINA
jgi:hypothetical protein